jgi:hypothetical protein
MRGHHVLDIAELLTPDETDETDGAGNGGNRRDSGIGNGHGTGAAGGTRPATALHAAAPVDGPSGPSAADGPAAVVS